jgi:hypothetical protein
MKYYAVRGSSDVIEEKNLEKVHCYCGYELSIVESCVEDYTEKQMHKLQCCKCKGYYAVKEITKEEEKSMEFIHAKPVER